MTTARTVVDGRRGDTKMNLPSLILFGFGQFAQQPAHKIGTTQLAPSAHAALVLDRRRVAFALVDMVIHDHIAGDDNVELGLFRWFHRCGSSHFFRK